MIKAISFGAILSPDLRQDINAYRTDIRNRIKITRQDWLDKKYSPSRANDLDVLKRLEVFSARVKFLSPKKIIQRDFYLNGDISLLSQVTREKCTGNPNGTPNVNIEILEEVAENLKRLG